jgi:hypothetical protein
VAEPNCLPISLGLPSTYIMGMGLFQGYTSVSDLLTVAPADVLTRPPKENFSVRDSTRIDLSSRWDDFRVFHLD